MQIATHRLSLSKLASAIQTRPSELAVDLVSVAAQLYAADRSQSRGRRWKRSLPVSLLVSNPEPWHDNLPALAEALMALTDDTWDLSVSEGRQVLPEERQPWLLKVNDRGLTSVALFSGGLDSFAGAAVWLDEHPEGVLGLVSISSSRMTGRVQKDLIDVLEHGYPGRVLHLRVPLNLVAARDVERSQRTRGLVYTAVATAIATCANVEEVLIFENGYGAVNPRLLEYQEGSQATKSTHPFVVGLLESVYQAVGFRIRIRLPHCSETKAEVLRRLPNEMRDGIRVSVSCDSYPLRIKSTKQCGYCGSCILRQQALRSSGLRDFDRKDYAESPFENSTRVRQLALIAYQARQLVDLSASENLEDVARLWPEVVLGTKGQLSLEQVSWLEMLRRYGAEWQELVVADPAIAARIGWLAGS